MANDFCRNAKAIRDSDDGVSGFLVGLNLHSMPHIEDLIHFFLRRSARSFNRSKDGGWFEEVVLSNVSIVSKLKAFRLPTAATVDERCNLLAVRF